ncbi:MAG: diguanylate cyclase [Nitrospirales bacterium]|nr:diguanylate cyclase [Nitrospirales bacterium]
MVIRMHEMYTGESAEVVAVKWDVEGIKRLRDMGIREGSIIDLLHQDQQVSRKVVVGLNNTRLAFPVELAENITVRPLKSCYETIRNQAHYDNLTGCLNRHATEGILKSEYEKFVLNQIPLSLLLADVDYFKRINDDYGHAAGDGVLKHLAALLRKVLRRPDLLCRWGGEEFLVILRGTILAEAEMIGERLRQAVESCVFLPFEKNGFVTVSIGGCGLPPERHIEHLVESADKALYKAKNNGRNQVQLC